MKTQVLLVASFIVAALMAAASSAAPPATPHVAEVVILDVGANMQKFTALNSRMDALSSKAQSTGKARYWVTSFAGPDAGHVVVVVEYPSLASMASSLAKVQASPDFAKWLADAQGSGIKVLSQSIITELPPQ